MFSWWLARLVWNRHNYAGALMQVILVSVLWRKQCFRLTSYLLIPAVMLTNESVKVYELPWIHTWGNGVVFWQWNNSVDTSASISVSAVVYYRFKRLIVDITDMSSKSPGFAFQHVWESRPCDKLPSSRFVCWSACRDYLPRLKAIPLLSQASHGLLVSLHTKVDAESQNISSVSKS